MSPAAQREQRRSAVAALILAGHSYREIARQLEVSAATVHRDVMAVMRQWRQEYLIDAQQHIQQDLKRVDVAMGAIFDDVRAGKLTAIDRMLRLLDQRAKYLGLYAPEKIQGELSITYLDQVREEDAVLAEYAEIIEDVIQRETSKSDTQTAVAPKTLPVGARQD